MSLCVFCFPSIFLFIAILLNLTESRRYDIEVEALKLYGEDINSVLQKFRKSPEYLKIISEKMNELYQHYDFIATQTLGYFTDKLNSHISESLGLGEYGKTDLKTTTSTSSKGQHDYRRDTAGTDDDLSLIHKLDTYRTSSIVLTSSERNSYRDLGFKVAGDIIHAIIKNFASDDEPMKSTRQPYEGDHDGHQKTISTTQHEHVHEVTFPTDAEKSTDGADTTIADSYNYRYGRTS